jgi:hypothetical protein
MKFRILYVVTKPVFARTESAALEYLKAQSDDLDEFCSAAITNSNVKSVLQKWVPMPTPSLPKNGQWENVQST